MIMLLRARLVMLVMLVMPVNIGCSFLTRTCTMQLCMPVGIFFRKNLRISILLLQVFIGVGAKILRCIGFSGLLFCRAIPRLVAYTLAGKTTLLLPTTPNHLTKLHLRRHRLVLDQ